MKEENKEISIDIAQDAINIVKDEKTAWENAVAWVTKDIGYEMRKLIESFWRNYYGVFKDPTDPVTGKKKIWYPLTEIMVEHAVKNYDIDTSSFDAIPLLPNRSAMSLLWRELIREALDDMSFGEEINITERDLAIQGTTVWKTFDKMDEQLKRRTLQVERPSLLNIYIDPTAKSIQDAYRFTERGLMTKDEISRMRWINKDLAVARTGLSRNDPELASYTSAQAQDKYVDVWETWGKIPLSLITGKKEDATKDVEGHIIVSGIEAGGNPVVHLIERNTKGVRPYEEAWYQRVSGRWYGRGVAEKVMWLQMWINTIINVRINRARVAQLGIFKVKRGANITPQMVSRLAANGMIPVNQMDDVEQFVIKEASESSYKDEEVVFNIARQVTSTFEAATGEKLPGETSATAAASQSQATLSFFDLIREGVALFLERWMKRQAIPVIQKNIATKDILMIADSEEVLSGLDESYVNYLLAKEIKNLNSIGLSVDGAQVAQEKQRALAKVRKEGTRRYAKMVKNISPRDFKIKIVFSNEKLNKAVLFQNLATALQVVEDPNLRIVILKQMFDTMGLPFVYSAGQVNQAIPQQVAQPTQQEAFTQANTLTR